MSLSLFHGHKKQAAENKPRARQKSLGLPALLPEAEGQTLRVLDLGSARTANLEFFSRYGGRLTVADFYSSLRPARAAAASDEARKRKAFAKLLDYEPSTKFDLILAWDLLNYLSPDEHEYLMSALEPFCLAGTSVHAFVATLKEMPPAPSVYWIEDEKTLGYEAREGRPRPCPRYLEQDLLKRMPGLSVEYRYQLRNGMLEYVFSYRMSSRAATAGSRVTASASSAWSIGPP